MYFSGEGVSKDLEKSALLYRMSALQGNVLAQRFMGILYYNGVGVPMDMAQAMIWLRKAADQGDRDAQALVGDMYRLGQGVPKDMAQAVIWLQKSADQGYIAAQYNLGYIYEQGLGVEKDIDRAETLYKAAAALGEKDASIRLALINKEKSSSQISGGDILEAIVGLAINSARSPSSDNYDPMEENRKRDERMRYEDCSLQQELYGSYLGLCIEPNP